MEMNELIMTRDELLVLINDLSEGDKTQFKVGYPFYGESLFTLDVKESELLNIVDKARLTDCVKKFGPNGLDWNSMVGFDDLRNCLLSAGVLEYRNEREVVEWLRELKRLSRDSSMMPKPFLIGLDTNILYDRFVSRHLSFQDSDRSPFHSGFRYVVCNIVTGELDHKVDHKYSHDEIELMRTTFCRRDLLNHLRNRHDLHARKALLGLNESRFLKQELKAINTPGQSTTNSEHNDREIARSYLRHARDNHCDIYLLTADEKMTFHAKDACDVATKQLYLPSEIPKRAPIRPWSVKNLLYDMAATMGAISLVGDEAVIILGEWNGKGSEEAERECVKVLIADQQRYGRVRGELETCRKIREISSGAGTRRST